jgi:hypothetical protein
VIAVVKARAEHYGDRPKPCRPHLALQIRTYTDRAQQIPDFSSPQSDW